MKQYQKVLLGIQVLAISATANALSQNQINTKLKLTKTLMSPTAEIITLSIEIQHSPDTAIRINQTNPERAPAHLYRQFLIKKSTDTATEIKHISYTHKRLQEGKTKIQEFFEYRFQVFEVEELFISPIDITLKNRGSNHTFYTAGAFIHILPPSREEIARQQKLYTAPSFWSRLTPQHDILILTILSITFLTTLLYAYKKLKRYKLFKHDQLQDAYTEALKRIQEVQESLQKSNPASPKSESQEKSAYQIITHTLKRFLERQCFIRTIESGPEETGQIFGTRLKNYPWNEELIEHIKSCTRNYCKKESPSTEKIKKDLQRTQELIQKIHTDTI